MNEDDLRHLLAGNEPTPPDVDRSAIVNRLVENGQTPSITSSGQAARWPLGTRGRISLGVRVAVASCAAGLFIWMAISGAFAPSVSQQTPNSPLTPPSDKKPAPEVVSPPQVSALEQSITRSDQLELELALMLEALPEESLLEGDQDVAASADQSDELPDTGDPTAADETLAVDEDAKGRDLLARLRSELRASEALWLVLNDELTPEGLVTTQGIIRLFPDSPAAARCRELSDM
jgi:hypothetical protein